jgi:biotin carboxyl carrier protein
MAALLHAAAERQRENPTLPDVLPGWRNVPYRPQTLELHPKGAAAPIPLTWQFRTPTRLQVTAAGTPHAITLDSTEGPALEFTQDGHRHRARVARVATTWHVHLGAHDHTFEELPRYPDPTAHAHAGGCTSPMPGKLTELTVAVGDPVEKGQRVGAVVAMKMEHPLTADTAGTVVAVHAEPGQQVDAGAVIVEIAPGDA